MFTANQLARSVVRILHGVVVHQWARWGPVMGHGRQMEGWWKAELLTALEAWCWSSGLPREVGVAAEVKPRVLKDGDSRPAPDILVAALDDTGADFDWSSGPRVWIEIKERGTWWGSASKAFGKANHGLRHDLEKWDQAVWSDAGDDVVLACHIASHESHWQREGDPFPKDWVHELDEIAKDYGRYEPRPIVGYPLAGSQDKSVRWVRMDTFRIHPPMTQE